MKNFIFKSQQDLQKMFSIKLEAIQSELRHQRSEHSVIISRLNEIYHELNLRSQANEYYKKYGEDETSPQTEQKTLEQ